MACVYVCMYTPYVQLKKLLVLAELTCTIALLINMASINFMTPFQLTQRSKFQNSVINQITFLGMALIDYRL